jgi:hypothetical protein
MDDATVNIHAFIFLCGHVFISTGYLPKIELLGHVVIGELPDSAPFCIATIIMKAFLKHYLKKPFENKGWYNGSR